MHYLYILYGLIGLSFLVFIHELGHYLVARYFKMRVDTFSIGFGPTLISWVRNDTEYKIGCIPFGGYVKVAGMDEDSDEEGSYFHAKPYQRLLMVVAGPIVNLMFAFLGFCMIYFTSGFLKDSVDSSRLIGMVDPKSELYEKGVRPGDALTSINGHEVKGRKGLFFHAVLDTPKSRVQGESINYLAGTRKMFDLEVEPKKEIVSGYEIRSLGLNSPASYLIFDPKKVKGTAMLENSPMKEAGLIEGDRLIWINGELIFSREQLQQVLAEKSAFLTVMRDNKVLHIKVPKCLLSELLLSNEQKEDLNDLKFEAKLPLNQDVLFIPYLIDQDGIVVASLQKNMAILLKPNDRIVAVDGIKTIFGSDVLKMLQTKHIVSIVAHGSYAPLSKKDSETPFFEEIKFYELDQLISKIGVQQSGLEMGDIRLLKPFEPMEIEHMGEKYFRLGVSLVDRKVVVNPNPFEQFRDTLKEITRLFGHLSQGELSPKFLSGPIGIVGAMQKGWSESFKDGIFWLSTISLNLGVMNLLPLPVLDGGHILFNLYEMITKRKIQRKVMEKILVPFVFLLIGFALFTTFHDLMKIFSFVRF